MCGLSPAWDTSRRGARRTPSLKGAAGLPGAGKPRILSVDQGLWLICATVPSERYGEAYLPAEPPVYRSRKLAQDAHEAIRPTSMEHTPDRVAPFLEPDELKLYTLVWNRFLASQMAPAIVNGPVARRISSPR